MPTLRYAIRTLRQSPGLAFAAVVSLALGIGANTAIFSLIDQVLLRPLPVTDPESLVVVKSPGPKMGRVSSDEAGGEGSWSYPMYKDLRDRSAVFSGLFARFEVAASLAVANATERGRAELVTGNYFEVLGVRAALGRLLSPSDDTAMGAHPVAVISHGYWTRRFGANPAAVNQTIHINGHAMTIVGVAARGFFGVQVGRSPDVFVPMTMMAQMMPTWPKPDEGNSHWMNILGRLKPGVSRESAQASLGPVYKPLLEAEAQRRNFPQAFREKYVARAVVLEPGWQGRRLLANESREPLLLLMGMVALVLLIACANVANLMLARGLARARDIAVRLAIGASRARLTAQLLTESIVLALAGGAAGVLVAYWTVDALIGTLMPEAGAFQASPDLRILAFTFALSMLTGLAFGLLPAIRTTRPDLAPVLKDQALSVSASTGQSRLRRALIVAQVALTVLLLITAGLFATSLVRLKSVTLGVETTSVVRFTVAPHLNGYQTPRALAFHRSLRESLAEIPGVRSSGFAEVPIFDNSDAGAGVTIQGYTPAPDEEMHLFINFVSPDYFATLGVPLRHGRDVAASDTAESPKVCWINEATARKYFARRNPVGYRIALGSGSRVVPDIEIVGVVADSKHSNVREQQKHFAYFPYTQKPRVGEMTYYVRAAQEPAAIMNSIRSAVGRLDANIPVVEMKTLERQVEDSLSNDSLMSSLAAAFAALAALLAAVGIYGVMAYNVARRTREIGIRVALGAPRSTVRNLVIREVLWMTAIGVALGLPAAYALGRFAESMLFGVKAADPLVAVAAVAAVLLVALLAGWLPARRATKIDPLVALRYE